MNRVDPAHYDRWDGALGACEFDAGDMRAIAEQRGFEPTVLLTAEATADAVVAGISAAAGELDTGDFFFLSYAGHGGQVPDSNMGGDEADRSDETWLLYDRQLVDDELYALWGTFRPGVRIFVVSDSCHSGTVTRAINARVPDVVADREIAAAQSPRYRAMPRDVMVATYRNNKGTYDPIQKTVAASETREGSDLAATVLLISGCQDDQLSLDGFSNGLFTENLLAVWDGGGWTGGYALLHEAIRSRMPGQQQPNYTRVGAANDAFEQQDPLTIG